MSWKDARVRNLTLGGLATIVLAAFIAGARGWLPVAGLAAAGPSSAETARTASDHTHPDIVATVSANSANRESDRGDIDDLEEKVDRIDGNLIRVGTELQMYLERRGIDVEPLEKPRER